MFYSIFVLVICFSIVTSQSTSFQHRPQVGPQLRTYDQSRVAPQAQQSQSLSGARSPHIPNAPRLSPTQPGQVHFTTGHHKIIDPNSNKVLYHRYYNSDGHSNYEVRQYVSNPKEHLRPLVSKALADSYLPAVPNQPKSRDVSYRSSPFQTNGYYYQPNQQHQRRAIDQSSDNHWRMERTFEDPNSVALNRPGSTWLDNIEKLVSLVKSSAFLNQVGQLGSQLYFKSNIVGKSKEEDDEIISSNVANTRLNFTSNRDDCVPKMTTIKFGDMNKPEISYNPSSVEVLRCPQACFSWQFDCVPTKKASHDFSVAIYTINGDLVTRKVELYTIDSHESCACSCQSLAGCFANLQFSSQRLPPTR